MTITRKKITSVLEELKNLPPIEEEKEELTKRQAVRLMIKEITALQKRGYSLKRVQELLESKGVSIGLATLKSYLSHDRPRRTRKSQKANKAGTVDPATSVDKRRASPKDKDSAHLKATVAKQKKTAKNAAKRGATKDGATDEAAFYGGFKLKPDRTDL